MSFSLQAKTPAIRARARVIASGLHDAAHNARRRDDVPRANIATTQLRLFGDGNESRRDWKQAVKADQCNTAKLIQQKQANDKIIEERVVAEWLERLTTTTTTTAVCERTAEKQIDAASRSSVLSTRRDGSSVSSVQSKDQIPFCRAPDFIGITIGDVRVDPFDANKWMEANVPWGESGMPPISEAFVFHRHTMDAQQFIREDERHMLCMNSTLFVCLRLWATQTSATRFPVLNKIARIRSVLDTRADGQVPITDLFVAHPCDDVKRAIGLANRLLPSSAQFVFNALEMHTLTALYEPHTGNHHAGPMLKLFEQHRVCVYRHGNDVLAFGVLLNQFLE